MLLEEAGKYDIDMFLLPATLEALASISSFWVSTHTPPLKLFSERPGFLQLFHHPLAMFLELPENCEIQEFKAKLCQLLYDSGVEVPLALGIVQVYLGQFGCKYPLQEFLVW